MKNKSFDCVRMKWDLQRKQREELAGMSEAERRRIQMDRVAPDPILGPFMQRTRDVPSTSSRP